MLDAWVLKQHFPLLEVPGRQGVIQLYDLHGGKSPGVRLMALWEQEKTGGAKLHATTMPQALSKLLCKAGASQPLATSHFPTIHWLITDAATTPPCCSAKLQQRPFAQELWEDPGRGMEHGENVSGELQFAQVHTEVQSSIVFNQGSSS